MSFGSPKTPSNASFEADRFVLNNVIGSSAHGDIVRAQQDITVDRAGTVALWINQNNQVIAGDIRNGSTTGFLAPAGTLRGISFGRDGKSFVVGQLDGAAWYVAEYLYPEMTFVKRTDVTALGAGQINSVKFSPNNRYYTVGSTTGLLIVDARTIPPSAVSVDNQLVGPVFDSEMAQSLYCMYHFTQTDFHLNIVNNAEQMTYLGAVTWQNIVKMKFNWDIESVNVIYPHMLVGGVTGGLNQVIPYVLNDYDYKEGDWRVTFPETIKDVVFSEMVSPNGVNIESKWGRSFAVVGPTITRIYNLIDGNQLYEFSTTNFNGVTGAVWKEATGIYL